ncbi:MAG: hypothetical protein AAGB22_00340, partial [Bacteroidota bacterium]
MRTVLRLTGLILLVSLWGCRPPAAPVEFIVLQLNDVYEIAPLENGQAGGMARVATLRNQLLAENPRVITVLSG